VQPTTDFANLYHHVEKNEKFANRPPDPAPDAPQFPTNAPTTSPEVLSVASGPNVGFKVFQNTIAQLGGKGGSILLSAATSILLARYLGRERLGEYGAIFAYLSIYSWLVTFSLEQILARDVSQRRSEASALLHTGSVISCGFAFAAGIIAPLAAPLFGYTGPLRWLIAIAAVDLLIMPPFKMSGIIFQVDMRQWYAVGIGFFRQILWLIAVALLAFSNAAFYKVIIARTLCGVIEAAITIYFIYRPGFLDGPRTFLKSDAARMMRDAFPLVLSALAINIYHRIDQVMLHKMSGDKVLGPYVIAVQLTELFSTLPVALMSSLYPVLAVSAHDEVRFRRYLSESFRFLMVVAFAACALVTPVARPFIELVYGKQFSATAELLIVLIWSEAPIFFGVALGNAIVSKGLQKYLPASAASGAIVNVAINLAVIPRYGALGASWATVISYCLAGIFFLLVFRELRPLVLMGLRISVVPFLLALAITFGLQALDWAFWWKLIIAAIAYPTGAWLFGAVRNQDIQYARQILESNFNLLHNSRRP
jgi:O-antigen/teichoic acid export membrane protein